MLQVHLDALIMLATLMGGYKTRPYDFKQTNNYVVARFIRALWVGCWYFIGGDNVVGYKTAPMN
jgi:hypothetical protein